MAKAGWKKGKRMDQIDTGLMSLKSSPSETKRFIPQAPEKGDAYSRPQRLDPLTEYLGCTSYYSQMRWVWFRYDFLGKSYALEVSRFYHERNLALDIAPANRDQLALKAELLEKHGIKYIVLDSANDIKGLSMEAS